jgi:hypothetical protein
MCRGIFCGWHIQEGRLEHSPRQKKLAQSKPFPKDRMPNLVHKLVSFKKPTGKTFAMHSRLDNLSNTLG